LDTQVSSPSNGHSFKQDRKRERRTFGRDTRILLASSQYILLVLAWDYVFAFQLIVLDVEFNFAANDTGSKSEIIEGKQGLNRNIEFLALFY
jgi:hypothetical protein